MPDKYPSFIVCSGHIARPFDDPVEAIHWHGKMYQENVPTIILDLTDYDWEENKMKLSFVSVDHLKIGIGQYH